MAVECRADAADVIALLAVLDHAGTRACVEAERAMNRALDGSCHVPVAAFASEVPAGLHLRGLVGSAADGRIVRAEAVMAEDRAEALGQRVAAALLAAGAAALIRASDPAAG